MGHYNKRCQQKCTSYESNSEFPIFVHDSIVTKIARLDDF